MIRSFLKGGVFYKTPQLHENASISKDSDIVNKWYVDTKVNVVVKDSSIPKGAIIMWSGSITTIPSGWALCNGANGTPNLVDRFVIGSGGSYGVGAKGGSKEAVVVAHTHTGSTNSTGEHTHNVRFDMGRPDTGEIAFDGGSYFSSGLTRTTTSAGNHSHTLTINAPTGANVVAETNNNANLPPYYALAFIMKL